MSLTHHIGYGRYCLEDFLPGELFARYDSSLGLVCDPQPFPPPTDHIQVWVDHGTSNARKVVSFIELLGKMPAWANDATGADL